MTGHAVDFHCHLDLYPDFEERIAACEDAGIYTLAVTTTPRAWRRNQELTSQTRFVRAALGLHPQLVERHGDEIAEFERLLPEAKYVGEVGLDATPSHYRSFEHQKAVFRRVLEGCAREGKKVLSVHSARAATPVLDMIEAHIPRGRACVVMHWFSGSKSEARRAVALGCWFSVNAVMLENVRLAAIVKSEIPRDRILTETDGPFIRGRNGAVKPGEVDVTIEQLARLIGSSAEETSAAISDNLASLLSTSSLANP